MQAPFQYQVVEMSDEEIAEEREVFGALAHSVRQLNDACVRTTVDAGVVDEVRSQIDALTQRLRESELPGPFGVQLSTSGQVRGHGNAVVGLRNPVAVPLEVERSDEGRAWSSFELGAVYEGPPGKVHGGVIALVLDQIFGEAAAAGGSPGMTGTLTIRYLKNTPLGSCAAEAWIERKEGVKTFVQGVMRDAEGSTTAEATGIFILPKWARELIEQGQQMPRFE